ncbi:MAG: biotin-dependent carboxyltransferase family protein [Anaerolineae bacterium]|jgi:biotin-dependent carboxylase-like uncharacterized protein|nr:biotin-dependent carboxyltransferase family protein [Anaerolineae bacterium]
MTITIIEAGPFATIQDSGRYGYQRYGMPSSGPMDTFAFDAANILVDNEINTSTIEFTSPGLTFFTHEPMLIAVTGPGLKLFIENEEFPTWMSLFIRKNRRVRIEKTGDGMWGYLAVSGGFNVPRILGSTATYLRGKIGGLDGRGLQADDYLTVGIPDVDLTTAAGRIFTPDKTPNYSDSPTLRVIMGPQMEAFTQRGIQTFLSQDYVIQFDSDRMGYRTEGAKIQHSGSPDIISDGIVTGSIQVPASGQPIIMMADHQTTGGYPKIATVIRADIPLLAQTQPMSAVRFCAVTPESAEIIYNAMMKDLLEKNWSLHETIIDHMQA